MIDLLDWKTAAAIIGLLSNIGFLPYIRDVLARKTQPHIYTWLIWAVTQGTAVVGVWYGGGGIGGIGLTLGLVLVSVVFVLCFKYGTKNITRSDTAILIAAFLSVLVWWQLNQPIIAVLMVTIIDALGYLPTFRKSFEEPWTETLTSYGIFAVGNVFSLFALGAYNLLTVPYLIMLTLANTLMVVVLLLRRRRIPQPATQLRTPTPAASS